MIVLKELAREFELDPYKVRMLLRTKFKRRPQQHWRWEDNDPELKVVREVLKAHARKDT